MGLGFNEILVILLVVLLLFGASRIPELAKSLGRASYEFKKAKEGIIKEGEELAKAAEKHAEISEKASAAENGSDAGGRQA